MTSAGIQTTTHGAERPINWRFCSRRYSGKLSQKVFFGLFSRNRDRDRETTPTLWQLVERFTRKTTYKGQAFGLLNRLASDWEVHFTVVLVNPWLLNITKTRGHFQYFNLIQFRFLLFKHDESLQTNIAIFIVFCLIKKKHQYKKHNNSETSLYKFTLTSDNSSSAVRRWYTDKKNDSTQSCKILGKGQSSMSVQRQCSTMADILWNNGN